MSTRPVRAIVTALALLCLGTAVPSFAQGAVEPIFTAPVVTLDSRALGDHVVRAAVPVIARQVVGMRLDRLFSEATERIGLNLFETLRTASRERVDVDRTGHRSWVGRIDGDLHSSVVFTERDGVVSGLITTGTETYQVRTAAAGAYVIERVDVAALPRESEPLTPPPGLRSLDAPLAWGEADTGAEIDVLFVYTPNTTARAGGTAQVQALISQVISNTNTAFQRSGILTRVRLVGSSAFTYTESATSMSPDLQAVTNSAAVQALRNQAGADLVQLLVHSDAPSCGVGWLMTSLSSGFASLAYSVADWRCAAQYTPSHEMGHNMGSHHAPEDGATSALFTYSFGYKSPARAFRTIMAYDCSGGSCPRSLNFSNPNATNNGAATGTSTQNNALSINNAANTVANFRQAVTTPTPTPTPPPTPPAVTPPGAPTGLVSTVSGQQVTVRWNAVTNDEPGFAFSPATSYLLQVGSASGAANLFNGNVGNVTSASGQVSAGTYFWRVFAINSAGTSPASQEAQFTVGPAQPGVCTAPPSAPQNFSHSVVGNTVALTWSAPASGPVTGYVIEAGSTPGLANLYNAPVGNVLGVTVTAPRGSYFVRLRAINACGTSGPSAERTVVVP